MEKRGRASVLERPLSKGKAEVSLSAFAFLFSELVQYADGRGDSVMELENRLAAVGWQVGTRMHELMAFRDWGLRRLHAQPEQALSYIRTTVWKALFDMIIENSMLVNRFISIPKDRAGLNCAAFAAGVVHGMLDAAELTPEAVEAHSVAVEGQRVPRTVILVKLRPDVLARARHAPS